jgi:hypothetical protein
MCSALSLFKHSVWKSDLDEYTYVSQSGDYAVGLLVQFTKFSVFRWRVGQDDDILLITNFKGCVKNGRALT